jgi:hypothetical protein
MSYNRLTANDTNLGPITIGERSKTWRPIRLTLESGCDEYPGCSLTVGALGWSARLALPAIIKPWKEWIDTSREVWSKNPKGGYWDIHRREYGFSLSDGFLQVFLGPQTHDSTTTRIWCKHLPWTQWRYVGERYFDLEGRQCGVFSLDAAKGDRWAKQREIEAAVPVARFQLEDFDGTKVIATTRVEESECRFGVGWFEWLSLFRRPRLRRSMRIDFSGEVGYEKGSWKGGMTAHGIDLLPGELHEAAMRRYCASGVRNKSGISALAFIGPA